MASLKVMFGLHSLAIEDALKGGQVPKVEVFGDRLFVVRKTAHLEGDKIAYGETYVFLGPNHVVTADTVRPEGTRSCGSNSNSHRGF